MTTPRHYLTAATAVLVVVALTVTLADAYRPLTHILRQLVIGLGR